MYSSWGNSWRNSWGSSWGFILTGEVRRSGGGGIGQPDEYDEDKDVRERLTRLHMRMRREDEDILAFFTTIC